MKYGISPLSVTPLRAEANDRSEMVTQALYGELMKIVESRKKWCKVRLLDDNYEGWVDTKQIHPISKEEFNILKKESKKLSADLVDIVINNKEQLLSIPMGSQLNGLKLLGHRFEGNVISGSKKKSQLVETALLYLNTPYLWGGKIPFGIDCSGFTQMVYKLNGHKLLRDASEQATQGEPLSFIEESEAGDLAFFDNSEGAIVHVGIIMKDNYIIHAHGQVRIDRLDHTGIFNTEKRTHTHKLRVIKRII
ncbi:MAG: C40 family peptidase [Bacteroidia bacterium]|nr:C40 family peptidase [Bacteroidia bacterium]NNM22113.1 C40 family peptidase [Flavobacteriaceae bacterium]